MSSNEENLELKVELTLCVNELNYVHIKSNDTALVDKSQDVVNVIKCVLESQLNGSLDQFHTGDIRIIHQYKLDTEQWTKIYEGPPLLEFCRFLAGLKVNDALFSKEPTLAKTLTLEDNPWTESEENFLKAEISKHLRAATSVGMTSEFHEYMFSLVSEQLNEKFNSTRAPKDVKKKWLEQKSGGEC